MNYIVYKAVFLLLLLSACTTSSKLITWKDQNKPNNRFSKILVIGITHDSLHDTGRNVEDYFVRNLKKQGYNTVTSYETFGNKELPHLEKEHTYVELCSQGIDAVLTIALLDERKANKHNKPHSINSNGSYFYNRILNYQTIWAIPEDQLQPFASNKQYLWEATLFNLATLTPTYWAQTQAFKPSSNIEAENYCHLIFNNMRRSKVIK